jgi:hypothetical protein
LTTGEAPDQAFMSDEDYVSYRRDLATGRQAAIQDYDKAIIAVTTVLLGLTLTLSSRTSHGPLWVLLVSWVLLLLNLACTVVSLILGYYSFNRQLRNLERNKDVPNVAWLWRNPIARVTEVLNLASVGLFILGVAFLVVATYLSMS